ncbi:hypothetical protein Lalb_Chr17g0339211 [Lupinus albus]|uniref:Uncharacterized protein n=1 Tax=Lupinus albus TaxID=3870 RepID=A0A6A4P9C0_LUPAL|nr:hypothetical protein Lalb_Chr17g0339211 [Lupinus albus]
MGESTLWRLGNPGTRICHTSQSTKLIFRVRLQVEFRRGRKTKGRLQNHELHLWDSYEGFPFSSFISKPNSERC